MGRLRIIPFEERHPGALARFSERTWRRPVSDDFLRWRYVGCPDLRGAAYPERWPPEF